MRVVPEPCTFIPDARFDLSEAEHEQAIAVYSAVAQRCALDPADDDVRMWGRAHARYAQYHRHELMMIRLGRRAPAVRP